MPTVDYKEILVAFHVGEDTQSYLHIPKELILDNNTYHQTGCYLESTNNFGCSIMLNRIGIYHLVIKKNGDNVKNASADVYYR